MFKFRQHPFYNMDGEIGAASESVEVTTDVVNPGSAEEGTQSESESSFARRLREHSEKEVRTAREAWEKETGEKYKDYDVLKTTAEFFRERHGFNDLLSMKEEIELEQLQSRAEKEQVSPEVLRRIDELEARASEGDQIKQQVAEDQRVNQYRSSLDEFTKGKGIESDALNQFMIDNQLSYDPNNMARSFEIAFKAMDYDNVSTKMGAAKKDGVKEFLQAKGSIPTVPGSSAQGQVTSAGPKTFAEARQRAMQRLSNE